MSSTTRPIVIFLLTVSLLLPVSNLCMTSAQNRQNGQLTMIIGRPNIWSLSQAHYLLANLRTSNRNLAITTPGLDPNSINGARMNVLRTLLGIEAQVSTPQSLENSVAQQQFLADFNRKQSAIARLDELSRAHLQVIREISDLDIALATLGPKPDDKDKQVPETEAKRDVLTKQRDAKVVLRDAIAGQITNIKDQTTASVGISGLKDSLPLGTPTSPTLPSEGIGDIKDLVAKMLDKGIPDIDASQKLDNYIDFEYETIAKQLTLLRDEVGADERVIFLELPSSLYTVPQRDDDQMVHIEWTISELLRQCDSPPATQGTFSAQTTDTQTATAPQGTTLLDHEVAETLKQAVTQAQNRVNTLIGETPRARQRPPITEEYLSKFFALIIKIDPNTNRAYRDLVVDSIYADGYNTLLEEKNTMPTVEPDESKQSSRSLRIEKMTKQIEAADANLQSFKKVSETGKREVRQLRDMILSYPELLSMGWTGSGTSPDTSLIKTRAGSQRPRPVHCGNQPNGSSNFRVIDVIPRQSALNVNDVHATQKGLALTAKFLTLFGFGGQVSYQRQRSIYDQFISQDVFASGFGKGTDRFGWTIGPVPGTNRLAPGPRTTFAILAIPKDSLKISLQASAVAFHRSKDPSDKKAQQILTPNQAPVAFDLFVPSDKTEGFTVDTIDYTPVQKGQRVTAVLNGYFSPLTGVLVNGVPLKRAVAIAKHESPSTTLPVAADSPGEYEYLNSGQMIVSFATADSNFVGTPLITLVTPERTETINFQAMTINAQSPPDSLQHHSVIEPMFLDNFGVLRLEVDQAQIDTVRPGYPITLRLIGTGFRGGAEICLNDDCTGTRTFDNSGLYELTVNRPVKNVWEVTYRLGQERGSTSFNTDVDGVKADSPTIESVENPTTGKAEGSTKGGYTVVIRGANLQNVSTVKFGDNLGTIGRTRHPNVLLVEVPDAKEGAVQVLLTGRAQNKDVSNILDFVTPGKAIFKFVKPENPKPQTKPKPKPQPKPAQQKPGRRTSPYP